MQALLHEVIGLNKSIKDNGYTLYFVCSHHIKLLLLVII